MSPDESTAADIDQSSVRTKALIGLSIALVFGIGGWLFLSRAADQGLERLARIDKMRMQCTQAWTAARTPSDSQRVDLSALADTIDPRSASALKRCGDLRAIAPTSLPNPREMSGEPMPRGLR